MTQSGFIPASIINATASGDRRAFRSFYDMAYPAVYRFVNYFLINKGEANDIVSEVFYIIWKRRESLLRIQDIKAYLYITCRNEVYHHLKQKEKYRNISIDDMGIDLSIESTTIDERLIEEDMLKVYNAAIAQLPERCKLVFLMVREENLKYKEIAKILSITEGTVEQQMNIAIRKIMAVVKKYCPSLTLRR
ncbi:MAG: RNA polymerase sigma-70 factor [Tannerellaceae bacterium]|jgi:RNA polymerase sigma-70 factor (ECF subfamily)|nr:RNA polymerase sigma-70 factor [Tannerellaceae bacterium]